MTKKLQIIVTVIITLFVVGFVLLFQQFNSSQKHIRTLSSQVEELQEHLKEATNKILELDEENSELRDRLSNVQHFNNNGKIGQGYIKGATNYTGQVLETKIDGEFQGWDGETIFKMMNGNIWQQVSYAYTYHYAYMPEVIIYRKNGAYYMKVEDVDDEIQVRQIR